MWYLRLGKFEGVGGPQVRELWLLVTGFSSG